MLRNLVAANVFTSALDEAATVFTYHPLFRDHLRSPLEADHPEQLPELHRRAAAWYRANGALDEAIVHTCEAGDLADANERLRAENVYLRREVERRYDFDQIIGASPAIVVMVVKRTGRMRASTVRMIASIGAR